MLFGGWLVGVDEVVCLGRCVVVLVVLEGWCVDDVVVDLCGVGGFGGVGVEEVIVCECGGDGGYVLLICVWVVLVYFCYGVVDGKWFVVFVYLGGVWYYFWFEYYYIVVWVGVDYWVFLVLGIVVGLFVLGGVGVGFGGDVLVVGVLVYWGVVLDFWYLCVCDWLLCCLVYVVCVVVFWWCVWVW